MMMMNSQFSLEDGETSMPYGTYRVLTSLCKEERIPFSLSKLKRIVLFCVFVALMGIEGRGNYMVKGHVQGTKIDSSQTERCECKRPWPQFGYWRRIDDEATSPISRLVARRPTFPRGILSLSSVAGGSLAHFHSGGGKHI